MEVTIVLKILQHDNRPSALEKEKRCSLAVAKLSDGRITLDSFYAGARYFAQLALPRSENGVV